MPVFRERRIAMENKVKNINLDQVKVEWHNIDWKKCRMELAENQEDLLKAYKIGDSEKVSLIQLKIVTSFSGRALAVKQVTTNSGKKTAGVDGVLWDTPESRMDAVRELKKIGPRVYKAMPVDRKWISKDGQPVRPDKSNGRPLGIPTMFDRAYQALWRMALDPLAEAKADSHSFGFRPFRGCQDARAYIFKICAPSYRPTWVLEGDIKKCFDMISHDWIIVNVPMRKEVLIEFLKAGSCNFEEGYRDTVEGVPQGGVISPLISNWVLDGMELVVQEAAKKNKVKGRVFFVRYADDFVVFANEEDTLKKIVRPAIEDFLRPRGLELSEKKTIITRLSDGFDFLGFNVRVYKDPKRPAGMVLLIKPSSKSIKRFQTNFATEVKRLRNASAGKLIEALNPIILGWGNYFRGSVASKAFSSLDWYMWGIIWRWLIQKFPKATKASLLKEHFKADKVVSAKGKVYSKSLQLLGQNEFKAEVTLQRLQKLRIVRKSEMPSYTLNPYDPADLSVLERWRSSEWTEMSARDLYVMKNQQGKCPLCCGYLGVGEELSVFYRIAKTEGGTERSENVVLLHKECHDLVSAKPDNYTHLVRGGSESKSAK